ncbi:MAG: GFA family protein [Polyangiales bacterium]
MSEGQNTHEGSCFCGAVRLTVEGAPAGAGYCHCTSCRSWSAGPVNAFTLWKTDQVKITQGAELIGEFHKTERSYRQWCTRCGGHLLTRHPAWGLIDVYAATIPSLPFQAGVHVNYAETVLRIDDGLPKLRDFPAELGGSGEAIPA